MSSVHIKSNVDIALEDLLQGIAALEGKELDSFIQKLLSIRARRKVDHVEQRETELLELINQSLPPATLERFQELNAKRQAETLTEAEHKELIDWNKDTLKIVGISTKGRATIDCLHLNRAEVVNLRTLLVVFGEHPPEIGAKR